MFQNNLLPWQTGTSSMAITSIIPPPVEMAAELSLFLYRIWIKLFYTDWDGLLPISTILMVTLMPAVINKFSSDSGKRSSWASHPKKPPNNPISEPWLLWVVAKEPLGSNSIKMSLIFSSIRSAAQTGNAQRCGAV